LVDKARLSRADAARLDLVLADLALWSERPDEAEALLQQAAAAVPPASRGRYEALYGRLVDQLSAPASQDIARAAQITEGMRYYDPRAAVEMMQTLESVSSAELAVRAANPRAERQLTGWLDLAWVIRGHLVEPAGVEEAVGAWKQRNPYHVLNESQALDTWLRYRQGFQPPARVAVILPAAGRLQAAGEAIRDGFLTAFAANPGRSELLFFPTSDDPQSPVDAYFSALDAGADWIVGPLRQESVEAILGLAGMTTPMLALNDLPAGYVAPPGLEGRVLGISLSQDAEAGAVAGRAAAQGFASALVLAPESEWGERMVRAFEDEFLQDDRQIMASLRYMESENDHSGVLQRALKIDESKARKQRLQNTLQTRLEFEPVRRQDVDMIFMPATPTQARLLRPQLKFHDAGDIPAYATGRVFSGQPDPARNRDLDGLRFPTTRWQLEHGEEEDIPAVESLRDGNLAALFALGQDAWNLQPWLELMHRDPTFRFPGQSGDYSDARLGNLRREPAWAVFRNGRPTALAAEEAAPTGK
jgi:outer membrane PBP1 activator LpoA protein